jgi:hypothetical protein
VDDDDADGDVVGDGDGDGDADADGDAEAEAADIDAAADADADVDADVDADECSEGEADACGCDAPAPGATATSAISRNVVTISVTVPRIADDVGRDLADDEPRFITTPLFDTPTWARATAHPVVYCLTDGGDTVRNTCGPDECPLGRRRVPFLSAADG